MAKDYSRSGIIQFPEFLPIELCPDFSRPYFISQCYLKLPLATITSLYHFFNHVCSMCLFVLSSTIIYHRSWTRIGRTNSVSPPVYPPIFHAILSIFPKKKIAAIHFPNSILLIYRRRMRYHIIRINTHRT
jgi:hypothetical protein